MSIEKYKKNTPDYIIPNTTGYSTDGENLRCYKLGNAGDIVGFDWCFATNFNDSNRYDNTITGISDTLEKNKNGYISENVDSNLYFDINKTILSDNYMNLDGGSCSGILFVSNDNPTPDIHECMVIENLDFNKVLLRITGYGTTINPVAADKINTDNENSVVLNAGYLIEVNIVVNDVINDVGNTGIRFVEYFKNGDNEFIKPYYINARELQIGSRPNTQSGMVAYNNAPLSKPFYGEQDGLTFNVPYWDNANHIVTTIYPCDKKYKMWEEQTRTTQYNIFYSAYVTNHATVTDLIHLLNSSGLRYYDSDHTTINDIKENVFIGVMDDDGITDCTSRIKGWNEIEQSDLPNKNRNGYDWDITDPSRKPVAPDTDDIESVGYGYFSNTTMGTLYALKNKLDLEKITQWLLTQTEKIDIANNVVSLKEIPFPLSTLGITTIDTNLKIGGADVTYQGSNVVVGEIVAPVIPTLSVVFADFDVPRLSNTFLDYSPYSKYELLVPFAPSPIALPDWVIGKNVKAIFLYDIYTTACQYVIECNGERICSVSGNFGIDRPISAQNVALKDSARLSSQIATASSVLGGVMSGATGNIGGIISGAVGGVSALSQMILSGKQNYMYTVGANGDSSTVGLYHAAHLKITRTLSAEDENFVHVYGKPLCQVRKLSSLSGYTKCDNVNTSGLTCSESEKQMIKNLLESGVHI